MGLFNSFSRLFLFRGIAFFIALAIMGIYWLTIHDKIKPENYYVNNEVSKQSNTSSKKDDISGAISMNQAQRDIHIIQNQVRQGNVESYLELRTIYLDYPIESFLFWALLMANEHDYPPAYYDVFYTYALSCAGSIDNFSKLDARSKSMALEYLNLAVEKNVEGAKKTLEELSLNQGDVPN